MFDNAPQARIDCWYPVSGNDYRPAAYGQVCRAPSALHVRMVCAERAPRATWRAPNDRVCTDSCLEFFLSPWPQGDPLINFEMNAHGTLLLGINEGGAFRCLDPALQTGCHPTARIDEERGEWEVTLCVPDALLREVFPGCEPAGLSSLRGNFYKCGDETDAPHYGSWNPVTRVPIDFHCPECFGEIFFA